ncbi:MAG: hypothetical protein JWN48_887 [Myxococcaceae bacterium]|nr:hypothetical protein [Myxococcaceae bacterium]
MAISADRSGPGRSRRNWTMGAFTALASAIAAQACASGVQTATRSAPAERDAAEGAADARGAIARLVQEERHWRDLGQWDRMRQAYVDHATIRVTWFHGEIDAFIAGSKQLRGAQSKHRLSPTLISVRGDRALAESSAAIELRFPVEGVLADITSSCRLLSRVLRTPQGWRLASLDAIYEKDFIASVLPGERLAMDMDRLRSLRPAYRFLAYVSGRPIPDDLPGDDRPELTKALYSDAELWLANARSSSSGELP